MSRSPKGFSTLVGASASLVAGATILSDDTARAASSAPQTDERKQRRYADGVYEATGQYGGLPSSLNVRIRLAGGVISAVQVGTPAKDPTSLGYQKRFAAAVPAVVVGKPIDQIKVGKLAGASGCPDGFNAALDKIRAKAAR